MPTLTALLNEPRYHRAWRSLLLMMMAVMSWFAFGPNPGGGSFVHADKLNHVLAFAGLGFAAMLSGLRNTSGRLKGALALLAYGGFIEVVQSYLPSRTGEWPDLVADGVGIALGMALAAALRRHWTASRPGP